MNIKKRYRTLWLLFCSAAMVLCGCQVAEGGRLPEGFEEEKVREKAECVVGWFNEEDIGSEGKDRLKKCGAFRKIEKTAVISEKNYRTGEAYGGLVLVGAYENGKIEFRILFDEEMDVIQFLLR